MNTNATTAQPSLAGLLPYDLALPRAAFRRIDFLLTLAILGDLTMVFAGLVLGYWVRFNSGWIWLGNEPRNLVFSDYAGLIGIGAVFLLLTFGYMRLYNARKIPRFREAALIIFKATTFWLFAFLSLNLVLKFQPTISRIYLLSSYIACLAAVLLWRWLFHRLLRCDTIAKALRQRVLFVGWTPEASRLTGLIEKDPGHPYQVVGWIPAPLSHRNFSTPPTVPELGDCTQLTTLLKRHEIDVVILADLGLVFDEIVALANICEKELVQFKIIPSYFQILVSGLKLEPISGVPILGVSELPLDRLVNRLLKRAVDILGAVVGLILSAPIIAVCGLLVYLESPGSIFYTQVRTGRNGKNFKIIKLRSMRLDAEKSGAQWAQQDDPRRLKIGAFMREWNLDEVPQFWNVLKGEMSLVGPRPERPELIANFKHQIPHYNARLASKPGLTGWAQVNGLRGNTSLVERVRYDLFYLENWSLWFDLQTMILTFFKRQNAY
jgi:exopolysaccharide biosynthesis polyprenyl glycosylphosphotransferase